VWLHPADRALLAERGVKITINTSSNLRLRSGLADVAAFKRDGLRFAIGLDGLSLEDDDDILREMRLAHRLHAGSEFDAQLEIADVLDAATSVGREVLDGTTPRGLIEGADADLMLIDRERLIPDLIADTGDDLAIVMTRATARHVSHLVVAGREVARDGQVLGVDVDAAERELVAMARKLAADAPTLAFVRAHRQRLAAFYRTGQHVEG
jgi:cytosine/adenosine deaminase-related metal-dependent hydrolase